MKKRIIFTVLAVILICSMCFGVSAAYIEGETEDGVEKMMTSASFNLAANGASATTGCEFPAESSIQTALILYYKNTNNLTVAKSISGTTLVSLFPSDVGVNGTIRAASTHEVVSSYYGSWSFWFDVTRQ